MTLLGTTKKGSKCRDYCEIESFQIYKKNKYIISTKLGSVDSGQGKLVNGLWSFINSIKFKHSADLNQILWS